jgi:hypothetical protein
MYSSISTFHYSLVFGAIDLLVLKEIKQYMMNAALYLGIGRSPAS